MKAHNFHIVASFLLVVSSLGFGQTESAEGPCQPSPGVYNPINTITVNACCNKTDENDEINRELRVIKDLLNTVLANSDCCCDHSTTASRHPEPQGRNITEPQDQTTSVPPDHTSSVPGDCYEAQWNGENTSGIYTIQPDGSEPFNVYCDMDTDGGGWTVFQRRVNGSVDFFRDWADYEGGFGSLTAEHWLGNKKLYYLTYQYTQRLRVDLADFENETHYAVYDHFSVGNTSDKYRLDLKFRSGNAGDALGYHKDGQFSTRDQDNDIYVSNCAESYKGGWWYQECHESNLNGLYLGGPHTSYADGIEWLPWRGYWYSLKFTEMKLRPAI